MRTVITYGTFDLFHVGHVRLLKRIRDLGDRLVVGLSSDEFNKVKGKKVIIPFADRKEILLSCRYVDDVFQENTWEQKREDIINKSMIKEKCRTKNSTKPRKVLENTKNRIKCCPIIARL